VVEAQQIGNPFVPIFRAKPWRFKLKLGSDGDQYGPAALDGMSRAHGMNPSREAGSRPGRAVNAR